MQSIPNNKQNPSLGIYDQTVFPYMFMQAVELMILSSSITYAIESDGEVEFIIAVITIQNDFTILLKSILIQLFILH